MLLTGCGAEFNYRNPVTGEVMKESTESQSSEVIEISSEEASVARELAKALENYADENLPQDTTETEMYSETAEIIETTEQTETEPVEEFNVDDALGEYIGSEELFGVKYTIYENGAEVSFVEESFAEIAQEIEHDGKTYPVVSLAGIHYEWEEYVIPENIKYIRRGAFKANYSNVKSQLKSIVIPDTVEYMSGDETFYHCTNLEQVDIPENIKTDKEWDKTFEGCSSLKSIIIPNGVERLVGGGEYLDGVFFSCSSLENVFIPDTVTLIGSYAFRGCSALQKIDIPESVTRIEHGAFSTTGIHSIDIPAAVTYFPISAIANCPNLEELDIPDTVTGCDGNFGDCTGLKKVKFSNNMPTPTTQAMFSGCTSLEEIIYPDSTMDINRIVFAKTISDNNHYSMVDMSNMTIYVPEKAVDYIQKKFPETTVKAKDSF